MTDSYDYRPDLSMIDTLEQPRHHRTYPGRRWYTAEVRPSTTRWGWQARLTEHHHPVGALTSAAWPSQWRWRPTRRWAERLARRGARRLTRQHTRLHNAEQRTYEVTP